MQGLGVDSRVLKNFPPEFAAEKFLLWGRHLPIGAQFPGEYFDSCTEGHDCADS